MKWNIKELKDFIKDLDDDVEVVIESIISGEERYCSDTEDIYTSTDDNSGDKLLVLVPKDIGINNTELNEDLIPKELRAEDWEAIKDAMLESTVSLTSDCHEYKDIMSKDSKERDMKKADRLIYLVNVLIGKEEYK